MWFFAENQRMERMICSECEWYDDFLCDRYGKIVHPDDWCDRQEVDRMAKKNVNYAFLIELEGVLSRMSTLTGKVGYAVMKTHSAIEPELKIIYQMRNNLVKKYSSDGESIKEGDENWNEFAEEYVKFLNESKVDISLYQIDRSEWNDDKVYCDTAQASDYTILKSLILKDESEN